MTHTPTLPNGFSRDFSEAPKMTPIFVYAAEYGCAFYSIGYVEGEQVRHQVGELDLELSDPLCWCPIPTPGDAVLKELAEGK